MRKCSKCLMVVLFAIIFMASQATVIGAQTKEDEHVTVKQELSKSEEENVITGKVFVTNNGSENVKNVLIQSTLPEGLQLMEGYTLEKEFALIEAGDTVTHEFKAVYVDEGQAGGDNTPVVTTAPATPQPEATTTPATAQPEATTTPQTDDNENEIFYVMGIIGAGSIIAYLIKNKKVQFTKTLAIMLCSAMVLGMGAMPNVKAEEGAVPEAGITVTDTITAEGHEFEIQSKVTYEVAPVGDGTFIGTIAKAEDHTSFIEGATIEFSDAENPDVVVKTATSNSEGSYTVDLPAGTYRIKISAPGYIPFECIEGLESGEKKHLETYLMIPVGEAGEEGIAGGTIKNAVTGVEVEGVTIQIRSGWNQTSGEIVATTVTDENGFYQVSLPLGNYTVVMSRDGYITDNYNIISISGELLNQNATIVPDESAKPTGDLRIVLTWGENPDDLDSHLFGPSADGQGIFHTYFQQKSYREGDVSYAQLDVDDITSYGPETTTVYKMNETGKYQYYIHDYTNGTDIESKEMSNSGAKIKVYRGTQLIKEFSIPANKKGVLWHVFDYDAATDSIITVNEYTDDLRILVQDSVNERSRMARFEK